MTPSSPDNLSLPARVTGVVLRPRSTLAAVVAHPRSAALLAVLTMASCVATAGLLATDVGQVALVDQWERTALAFGQPVDDARYAEMQNLSRYGVAYAAATSVLRIPVAATAIAGVLYGALAARGRRVAWNQLRAVAAHAAVILALRDLVAAPLNYVRESLASPITLARLFGAFDEASPLARFFALVDVFIVWWLVVLAIGVAMLARTRIRMTAATLIGAYMGIAVLLAGTMAILGGGR